MPRKRRHEEGNETNENVNGIKAVIKGPDGDRASFVVDDVWGCWLCTGAQQGDGYAMLNGQPAHRVAYKWKNGPIPDGHQVHHLCPNRNCIYPAHLIAMSRDDHNRLHRFDRMHVQ